MNNNQISKKEFQLHLEYTIKLSERFLADMNMMGDSSYDEKATPNQYFTEMSKMNVCHKYNAQLVEHF